MSHIKERLKQYANKYSGCYKYAGLYVKVIQDMIEQLLADLEEDEKENIPELKASVYRLIQMTTQKTAGQPGHAKSMHISWDTLDMELMRIVVEATALVLSGRLDELEVEK